MRPIDFMSRLGGDEPGQGMDVESLRTRLTAAEDLLRAVQAGEVDALLVPGDGAPLVYTRQGADTPFRLLIEQMDEGAATIDADGLLLYSNRRLSELLGQTLELMPATRFEDFVLAQDRPAFHAMLAQAALGRRSADIRLQSSRQGVLPVRLTLCLLPELSPPCLGLVAVDLTLYKRAEEQLRIAARVFDKSGEAIAIMGPDSMIQTVNAAFTRATGYPPEQILGQSINMINAGLHSQEFFQEMRVALADHDFWQGEIWNRQQDARIEPHWLTITTVRDAQGEVEHYVAVLSNLSQIKESQRKVEYLATHDVLTGLPNRALFTDRLSHVIAQARRAKTRAALLFIDLDNFKSINDTLGHDIGDELLIQAAKRLRIAMRDVDSLARLGGDEFTAILFDCSLESVNHVASRLIGDLSLVFRIREHSLYVTASIGVAFYPEDGDDPATLLKDADTAMYRAKEQGRNRVEFFKPDLNAKLVKRASIESGLRIAMHEKHLRLVYQPKFDMRDGKTLVGAEALLRWTDPVLGPIPPADFIQIAEANGMILDLGRRVQQMLLDQIASWKYRGLKPPKIAYNVSARSIREQSFSRELIDGLAARNLSSELVQVELTESALLENSSTVVKMLEELNIAGVTIAIDDFGTGYSSLSYLKRLPLTELKIDKSFVDGLGQDREDEAITSAILALAKALEYHAVAEGVETRRQQDWLQHHGCDTGQGYLFSRPLETADFEKWIQPDAGRIPIPQKRPGQPQ
jgi:two-component system CheB/CheR fusion protein